MWRSLETADFFAALDEREAEVFARNEAEDGEPIRKQIAASGSVPATGEMRERPPVRMAPRKSAAVSHKSRSMGSPSPVHEVR